MRRRVRVFPLFVAALLVLLAFFLTNRKIGDNIDRLQGEIIQANNTLRTVNNERSAVEEKLRDASTDVFVEYYARTQYNYVKQGELVFVMTNADELYALDTYEDSSAIE